MVCLLLILLSWLEGWFFLAVLILAQFLAYERFFLINLFYNTMDQVQRDGVG